MNDRHSYDHIEELARVALSAAGASDVAAGAIATATCQAEGRGNRAVGVGHLFDYLESMRAGRMDGRAEPLVRRVGDSVTVADARAGAAQVAFDAAYDSFADSVRRTGLGFLSVTSAFTVGELGQYVRRAVGDGFFALAGANSPALMSFAGSSVPLIGTNPLSFGCPVAGRPALIVDQASSQTAYVNIRSAAATGTEIPEGWAVDSDGRATTDPTAALDGALLPFGGYKGGNIALLVELLSVVAGSNWSSDAPAFDHGEASPGVGMFVLALDVGRFDSSLPDRVAAHFDHLASLQGVDVKIFEDRTVERADIELDDAMYERLRAESVRR